MLTNEEVVSGKLPLTDEEYGMLRTIYYARFRFLLVVLFGLAAATFWKVFDVICMSGNFSITEIINANFSQLEKINFPFLFIASFFDLFAIVLVWLVYFKRIRPVKRDFKNGWKEVVNYPIIQKQNFQQTGQYFIGTNHPDYLFHEVDQDTWQQVNVGDSFTVYRAPLSKYVFNGNGRYTIM